MFSQNPGCLHPSSVGFSVLGVCASTTTLFSEFINPLNIIISRKALRFFFKRNLNDRYPSKLFSQNHLQSVI